MGQVHNCDEYHQRQFDKLHAEETWDILCIDAYSYLAQEGEFVAHDIH